LPHLFEGAARKNVLFIFSCLEEEGVSSSFKSALENSLSSERKYDHKLITSKLMRKAPSNAGV
jgi:hypothetical protein